MYRVGLSTERGWVFRDLLISTQSLSKSSKVQKTWYFFSETEMVPKESYNDDTSFPGLVCLNILLVS